MPKFHSRESVKLSAAFISTFMLTYYFSISFVLKAKCIFGLKILLIDSVLYYNVYNSNLHVNSYFNIKVVAFLRYQRKSGEFMSITKEVYSRIRIHNLIETFRAETFIKFKHVESLSLKPNSFKCNHFSKC